MSLKTKFVGTKQIAESLQMSEKTVIRREASFHLDRCRDKASIKPRRYRMEDARRELNEQGFPVSF